MKSFNESLVAFILKAYKYFDLIGLLIFRRLILENGEYIILMNTPCDLRNFLGQSVVRFCDDSLF